MITCGQVSELFIRAYQSSIAFPTLESVSSRPCDLSLHHALGVRSLHGRPLRHALVPGPEVRVLLLDVVLLTVDCAQNLGVQGNRVPSDESKISVYRHS